ncbi:hypothetical protein VFPBJ_08918 [Purpureocillium lilacinum]|uniref:Uncharacterized protein n=1 Tax=Purpureocillium lilacinum TaxID=33203 RepID=A0A179GGC8_PURLI|nr:hypothetical protein VFPBJ_08918 [Purpureocillium lilacinum]
MNVVEDAAAAMLTGVVRMTARVRAQMAAETLARARTEVAGTAATMPLPREAARIGVAAVVEAAVEIVEVGHVVGTTASAVQSLGRKARGGGSQDNIQGTHPDFPDGRVMSVTNPKYVVGPLNQIQHNTGCERLLVIGVPDRRKWIGDDKKRVALDDLEPPRQRKYIRTVNERLPAIEAGDASGSAEKGTGSAPRDRGMDVDGVDAPSGSTKEGAGAVDEDEVMDDADKFGAPVKGGRTRERCGSCGKLTHELDSCVRPGRDGTLHGCPMCNSSAHNVEQCVKWPRMTIGQKYQVLVHNRGRMVPLYTEQEELWYHVFIQQSESMGAEMRTPQYFPYTREFGKGYFGDEEEISYWETFYDCYDHAILPVDNKTRDEQMVKRLFAGAVYQPPRNTARPTDSLLKNLAAELESDSEGEEEQPSGQKVLEELAKDMKKGQSAKEQDKARDGKAEVGPKQVPLPPSGDDDSGEDDDVSTSEDTSDAEDLIDYSDSSMSNKRKEKKKKKKEMRRAAKAFGL